MSKIKFRIQTNAQKSQFRDLGNGNWQILNVPITVDNAVMNGVLYETAENAKGLQSYVGKVAVLRHPEGKNGAMSALEGESLMNHYAGGHVVNAYNKDGVNYADLEFKEALMRAQDNGEYYLNRLKNGEAIGISTGLFFEGNKEGGITSNGAKYYAKAINQEGDHIAMLPEGEDPAGGKDTFIQFNGEQDEKEFVVNIDTTIAEVKIAMQNSEIEVQSETWLKRVIAQCKRALALKTNDCNNSDDKTILNNTEGTEMDKTAIIEALKAKGIAVNADISDAELLDLLAQPVAATNADNTDAITAAINAAIKPLADELHTVKTQLTANADKELDQLAEQCSGLTGMSVNAHKASGKDEMHKVLAKNGVTVGAPTATNSKSTEGKKPLINKTPWEAK